MRTVTALFILLVLVCVSPVSMVVASEPELITAQWLAGTWGASLPSPAGMGMVDTIELVLKADGTFTGDVQSARGGLIYYRDGKYAISDNTLVMSARFYNGPPVVQNTEARWTLARNGDLLVGTIFRQWNNSTLEITLKRAK